MKRKIYITEEQINSILNNICINPKLVEVADAHKTSLGDCPAFPPMDKQTYENYIMRKHYDELCSIFPEEMSYEDKINRLSELSAEIKKIEEGNTANLEKICFNIVNDFFNIPQGLITYKAHIVNDISKYDRILHFDSTEDPQMKFDDIDQISRLRQEVFKRRLIDALIMGASVMYSKLPKTFVGDIYDINPELPKLYKEYHTLNQICLYEGDVDSEMEEKDNKLGGFVNIHLGSEENRTVIEVFATNFVILLSESIRGFLELFASHGLPKNREEANFVMSKADFIKAEPWDMRLGPEMWQSITNHFGDLESKYLPSFFTKLVEIPTDSFFPIMSEILGDTKKGEMIVKDMIKDVKEDIDASDFRDKIKVKNDKYKMLADAYFSPKELLESDIY